MPIAPPRAVLSGWTERWLPPDGAAGNGWVTGANVAANWQKTAGRVQDSANALQAFLTRDAPTNDFVFTVDVKAVGLAGVFVRTNPGITTAAGYLLMTDGGVLNVYPVGGSGLFGAPNALGARVGLVGGANAHTWQVECRGTSTRWTIDGYLIWFTNSLSGLSYNGVGLWSFNAVNWACSYGPCSVRPLGRETSILTAGLALPGRP